MLAEIVTQFFVLHGEWQFLLFELIYSVIETHEVIFATFNMSGRYLEDLEMAKKPYRI